MLNFFYKRPSSIATNLIFKLPMKEGANNIRQEKDKLEIIKWVTTLKDDTSIERLKMLMNTREQADWWEQISEEEKAAIDKGLADSKAGRLIPHEEVKQLYEKWL